MKLPPSAKNSSSSLKGSSLTPNSSLHSFPKLMPPRQMGETLTEAVGERIRWFARGLEGLDGGWKRDILVIGRRMRN